MALSKTCVHDRPKNRGPIITPRGSWCFCCDDHPSRKPHGGTWSAARGLTYLELTKLDREYFTEIDDQPLPSFAQPRRIRYGNVVPKFRSWTATMPIMIDPEDLKAAEEVSEYVKNELYTAMANDFDAHYSSYLGESLAETQSINRTERANMSYKRATYTVPERTREIELKLEGRRPGDRFFGGLPSYLYPLNFRPRTDNRRLNIDVPQEINHILILADPKTIEQFEDFQKNEADFKKFQRLQEVNRLIKTATRAAEVAEKNAEYQRTEADKAYQERHTLARERQTLIGGASRTGL